MIQYNNFLMKREQSRAGSRFAECEKSRLKAKILITLALLLTAVTGAWAQVVLWDGTGKEIGSDGGFWNCAEPTVIKEEDNEIIKFTIGSDEQNRKAQLPIGDFDFKSLRRLTFRMKMADQHDVLVQIIGKDESYTVERTATYNGGNSWQDMVFEFGEGTDYDKITDTDNYSLNIWPYGNTADGQGKNFYLDDIKLVSESGIEVTWDAATKTASFTMPAFDVEIDPIYAPTAVFATDGEPTAIKGIIAGEAKDIVKAGTVATTKIGEADPIAQGTVMYAVTTENKKPTSTEGFSATVPTGAVLTGSYAEDQTVYVWYYIKGIDAAEGVTPTADNTFNDSEIMGPVMVELLTNEHTLNIKQSPNITVTVAGTPKTPTDDKVTPVTTGQEVKIKAKEGYKFRKVEVKKGEAAVTATITVAKGSTDLSGDKLLYYTPGETYRQAIANHPENKLDGGLGWNIWEGGNDATIFYKESADKSRDLSIDGDQHFRPTDSINLDTVIDPTLNFYFVAQF